MIGQFFSDGYQSYLKYNVFQNVLNNVVILKNFGKNGKKIRPKIYVANTSLRKKGFNFSKKSIENGFRWKKIRPYSFIVTFKQYV